MFNSVKTAFFTVAAVVLLAAPALALEIDTKAEIENLRRRIAILEGRKVAPEEAFTMEALGKKLTLWGSIELDAFINKPEGASEDSDLLLSTGQLGVSVEITENVGGHVAFLHEEDADESIEVDEVYMSFYHPKDVLGGKVGFAGGKMYAPFGRFSTNLVTDPLTLDLGETNKTTALLGWEHDHLVIRAGVFNGDTDLVNDNDNIDAVVALLEITPVKGFTFGGSYISDIAETDIELVKESGVLPPDRLYDESVPAAAAFLNLEIGAVTLDAEYVAAMRTFDQAVINLGEELTGPRPRALSVELGLTPAERWALAVRYEDTDDFQDDLRRYGGVVSVGLFKNTVASLEYLFSRTRGLPDEIKAHTVTAQFAFQF